MPLVRLAIPMMAGVATYLLTGLRLPLHACVVLFAFMASWLLMAQVGGVRRYGMRWLTGTLFMLLFYMTGYLLARQHDEAFRSDHFSRLEGRHDYLLLRLTEPPAEKANSWQLVGRVTHLLAAGHSQAVSGRIMLYVEKDSLAAQLRYGDIILTTSRHEEVSPPGNPDQFNYKRFLARRNIHHSSYRRAGQWHFSGENRGHVLVAAALALREQAMDVFARHLPQGREYAVISALLLGYRDLLDEDLQREFAGAGAMHILCVSGLHVGIIYMVLKTLLAFLIRFRYGQGLQIAAMLTVIWLYAAVTGFSPSVLRASAMFSFVAVGQGLNRSTNIYNTLAASALLLMAIDPYIITRIGFQLSYLAVISIVALQPKLYSLLKPPNKLLDRAWAITTVSIAAQLATGPLALHYFNQFPNYFILTNLAVIPLSALIIYSGLLTLTLSFVPFVGYVCGQVLFFLLMALHNIVRFIERLPYSTTEDVFLSVPATMSLLLMMAGIMAYLLFGQRRATFAGLLGVLLLLTLAGSRAIQVERQQMLVVYQVSNATAVELVDGRQRWSLRCDLLIAQPERLDFHARQHHIRLGSAREASVEAIGKGGRLQVGSKAIVILAGNTTSCEGPADLLIVTGNTDHDPVSTIQTINPAKVIVDASNSFHTMRRWQDACDRIGIRCWPVREKGAFVWRLGEGVSG